jgi:hypothetical protein
LAWIISFQQKSGSGRIQPTQVVGHVKVFVTNDSTPVIQIDTMGSTDRENPGKQSQTLQMGRESAKQLFDLLKQTYNFE